jgi:hypothetical protein
VEVHYDKSKPHPGTKENTLAYAYNVLGEDGYKPGRILPSERVKFKILWLLEKKQDCAKANSVSFVPVQLEPPMDVGAKVGRAPLCIVLDDRCRKSGIGE